VVVVVGQQHGGDLPGGLGDGVEVAEDLGAGVDDDRPPRSGPARHPGVGAVAGDEVGVRGEHAGGPLTERPTTPRGRRLDRALPHTGLPGPRRRSATSGRSRSRIDSVHPSPSGSTLGVNIVADRCPASAKTASGSAYWLM